MFKKLNFVRKEPVEGRNITKMTLYKTIRLQKRAFKKI